ncbi:unnamed protein product [Ixodes persulcatus]
MANFWRIPHAMHQFKILLQKKKRKTFAPRAPSWCALDHSATDPPPLIPLLEAMAVPLKQSKKFETTGAKSPSLTGNKYRPRSRSGVKCTPIRTPVAKIRSPSWPDLPCRYWCCPTQMPK